MVVLPAASKPTCVKINQCVGCTFSATTRPCFAIQHERAAKFLFPHSYQDHKYAHLLLAEHALPDARKRETHG